MTRNTSILKIALLFSLICHFGCSEFIEPSIKDQTIAIIAPGDRLETSTYLQTFWWNKLDDALKYKLEVVSPSFDSVSIVALDTTVTTDKFAFTLDPGKYEWRVRAENGSSATAYVKRSFTIYPSALTDQIVTLKSPANGNYSASADWTFEWQRLFGATSYRLQIDNNNFLDEANLTINIATDNLSFIQKLTAEGTYQFRVRAENATETSKWSTVRSFTYDATPPAAVVLSLPTDQQSVAKPVRLLWNKVSDADRYELYIYKNDGSVFNNTYPLSTTSLEASFSLGNSGETILWRVRAIDKGGNVGEFSPFRSFTLQ
ncbi:hypothetical protein ACJVDH_05880 [Pedobacter sp. AW1-32]|uniref:hypothetical protein n=1 Tax=Pedobacter sp. AW1-32 TaxID=3383026 RepID=UPI003FEE490B